MSYNYYGNQPFYGNYQQYQFQQPMQAPQQQQMPMQQVAPQTRTNIMWVTSLNDALAKQSDLNSVIMYLDQSKPYIYEITTDVQGRKYHRILEFKIKDGVEDTNKAEIDTESLVSKQDYESIVERLNGLVDVINGFNDRFNICSDNFTKINEELTLIKNELKI